jgi:hypothetical protein
MIEPRKNNKKNQGKKEKEREIRDSRWREGHKPMPLCDLSQRMATLNLVHFPPLSFGAKTNCRRVDGKKNTGKTERDGGFLFSFFFFLLFFFLFFPRFSRAPFKLLQRTFGLPFYFEVRRATPMV